MKKSEIQVGGLYRAKVSGRLTTVRVDEIIYHLQASYRKTYTGYAVTNLTTGRKLGFRSAAKFRATVKPSSSLDGPGHRAAVKEAARPVTDSLHQEGL